MIVLPVSTCQRKHRHLDAAASVGYQKYFGGNGSCREMPDVRSIIAIKTRKPSEDSRIITIT
jgi:hypothetical protein